MRDLDWKRNYTPCLGCLTRGRPSFSHALGIAHRIERLPRAFTKRPPVGNCGCVSAQPRQPVELATLARRRFAARGSGG